MNKKTLELKNYQQRKHILSDQARSGRMADLDASPPDATSSVDDFEVNPSIPVPSNLALSSSSIVTNADGASHSITIVLSWNDQGGDYEYDVQITGP